MTRLFRVSGLAAAIVLAVCSLLMTAGAAPQLVVWGNTPGDAPDGLGEIQAIAGGSVHCLAVDATGVVTAVWLLGLIVLVIILFWLFG